MSSKSMYHHAKRIMEIIERHGEIHKFDLIEEARISLSLYEKLKPWIEYKFADFVTYDKTTKKWKWIAVKVSAEIVS